MTMKLLCAGLAAGAAVQLDTEGGRGEMSSRLVKGANVLRARDGAPVEDARPCAATMKQTTKKRAMRMMSKTPPPHPPNVWPNVGCGPASHANHAACAPVRNEK